MENFHRGKGFAFIRCENICLTVEFSIVNSNVVNEG